ncbi:hypothetical protein [Hoeflea sp.]|uniref:hypothetical protein n=1 Tax=Hoeflea sp. TaxID=1940281 RepID=UPI003748C9BA
MMKPLAIAFVICSTQVGNALADTCVHAKYGDCSLSTSVLPKIVRNTIIGSFAAGPFGISQVQCTSKECLTLTKIAREAINEGLNVTVIARVDQLTGGEADTISSEVDLLARELLILIPTGRGFDSTRSKMMCAQRAASFLLNAYQKEEIVGLVQHQRLLVKLEHGVSSLEDGVIFRGIALEIRERGI